MRDKKQPLKRVYILPNLITASSMMCGLLAIFTIIRPTPDYDMACYLIVIAAMLDFLDGKVARMTRATSTFGEQFDSLADLVSFGVAPAALIFTALTHSFDLPDRAVAGVCVPFAICSALRLARFNVQSHEEEKVDFTGMPTPAAGGCMVGLYFLIDTFIDYPWIGRLAPCLVLLVAYLMVSRVRYPSLKRVAFKRKSFDSLVAFVLLAGLAIALMNHFRIVLMIGSFIYASVGLILALTSPSLKTSSAESPLTTDK